MHSSIHDHLIPDYETGSDPNLDGFKNRIKKVEEKVASIEMTVNTKMSALEKSLAEVKQLLSEPRMRR